MCECIFIVLLDLLWPLPFYFAASSSQSAARGYVHRWSASSSGQPLLTRNRVSFRRFPFFLLCFQILTSIFVFFVGVEKSVYAPDLQQSTGGFSWVMLASPGVSWLHLASPSFSSLLQLRVASHKVAWLSLIQLCP